jgi:hypothetical protein
MAVGRRAQSDRDQEFSGIACALTTSSCGRITRSLCLDAPVSDRWLTERRESTALRPPVVFELQNEIAYLTKLQDYVFVFLGGRLHS